MFSKIVVALALLAGAQASLVGNSTDFRKFAFEEFKVAHNRVYDSPEEEEKRFAAFVETLALIDERNAAERANGGSAMHGITRFADLTQKEFEERYLTTRIPEGFEKNHNLITLKPPMGPDASGSADWTGVYSTPVKDQGYCGSCWAFSVTEQLESDAMRQFGTSYIMSPQELVSCDSTDSGCNGGWPTTAYDWIEKEGGLVSESDYPYTSGTAGISGTCDSKLETYSKLVTVTDYYTLRTESSMASYALATGPIAIAVDANSWSTYTGGVMSVCGKSIDHAVQITGINLDENYWKVRNSWGSSWGESGYIRLEYGVDICAITTIPTYTTTKLV